MNLKSRKTIFAIIGILGAVFGFVAKEFGLTIDPAAVLGTVVIALIYIFGEGKLDLERFKTQANRFADPKFLVALFTVIITQLNTVFGWNLPIEFIVGVMSALLGIIFKIEHKNAVS